MTEKVRAVFDLLGVEPNEEFKLSTVGGVVYIIDEELIVRVYTKERTAVISGFNIFDILNDSVKIIKLPKKKKLRDVTPEEWGEYYRHCPSINGSCAKCIFLNVVCAESSNSWVYHKDLYSDKFLNQEIEIEVGENVGKN